MIQLSQLMADRPYPESGQMLYDYISPLLANGESVTLDMTGVVSLPSMFLNASIGMAARNFGVETIKKNIAFRNVTKTQADRLKEYFARL